MKLHQHTQAATNNLLTVSRIILMHVSREMAVPRVHPMNSRMKGPGCIRNPIRGSYSQQRVPFMVVVVVVAAVLVGA